MTIARRWVSDERRMSATSSTNAPMVRSPPKPESANPQSKGSPPHTESPTEAAAETVTPKPSGPDRKLPVTIRHCEMCSPAEERGHDSNASTSSLGVSRSKLQPTTWPCMRRCCVSNLPGLKMKQEWNFGTGCGGHRLSVVNSCCASFALRSRRESIDVTKVRLHR